MNHFSVSLKQENGSCRDEEAGEPPQKVVCDWASAAVGGKVADGK